MTKFEAESKRDFLLHGTFVTAKSKIAFHINSNWIYSAHWKEETWVEQAKEDCLTRIGYIEKELAGLRTAQKMLENIS